MGELPPTRRHKADYTRQGNGTRKREAPTP
nr:MAG TPA: hypothetical protein [Caudoviricetes sp.]